MELPELSEILVRARLRNVLHFPMRVAQITGSFPFLFGRNCEISFRFLSKPAVMHIIRSLCSLAIGSFYYMYKNEYVGLFMEYSKVDRVTSDLITSVGIISDLFTTIMTISARDHFIIFHNQLITFILDIMGKKPTDAGQVRFLEMLETRGNWVKRGVVMTVCFAAAGYIGILWQGISVGLTLQKVDWLLATLPLVGYYMIPANILRIVHVLVIVGILSYLWFGMRLLRHHLLLRTSDQNCLDLVDTLRQWKRMNEMIEEFNVTFQWPLVSITSFLVIFVLCVFYDMFSWLGATGLMSAMATLPGIMASLVPFLSLCAAAASINSEGKLCVQALRDLGTCEWVENDNILSRNVRMSHFVGAMETPEIRPGKFFTLGRRLIQSVSYGCKFNLDICKQLVDGDGNNDKWFCISEVLLVSG